MGCAASLQEHPCAEGRPMIVGAKTLLQEPGDKQTSRQDAMHPGLADVPEEACKDIGADDATAEPESRRGSKQSNQSEISQNLAGAPPEPEARRGSKQSKQSQESWSSSVRSFASSSTRGAEVKERDRLLEIERRELLQVIKEHYAALKDLGEADCEMPEGLNKSPTKVLKQHWENIQAGRTKHQRRPSFGEVNIVHSEQ